ncbi:MAG: zinc ribbon domain-containing protein [Oscillospiraceae bacterium]|nr:zinc ribbon domain-containing protein [Oscillospiraceae bacterium]MBR3953060.1 zinc ribbon domain-containing protein [Oscillospiraceae bacterium]
MAFLDKINDFAKVATEKTNNAIESTRLSVKIEGEQRTIDAIIKKIGEYYVAKIDSGEILEEEVMSMYEGILSGREKIEELRAEIESLKSPKEVPAEDEPAKKICKNCGKEIDASAKFCLNCGTQQ